MSRGDAILVRFPHPSGARGKKRSAVVIQADAYRQAVQTLAVAEVTKNLATAKDGVGSHRNSRGQMMPETIDVTGLPEPVIQDMRRLVNTLRERFGAEHLAAQPVEELTPADWIARFRAWAESHPKREIVIDDSRETIYGGRGE